MKIESRLFEICGAFFVLCGVAYAFISAYSAQGVEPVGVVGLFLTAGLAFIVGTYFRFVSRRLEARPEDNPEAEVSDGAGDVGFFSPGSYWPVGLAAAAALTGISLAFFQIWLLVIGLILVLFAVGGLVFEYHIHPSDH